MREHGTVSSALNNAIITRDADAVEMSLDQAFEDGPTLELAPILIKLLAMPWHYRHEDVVSALQKLKPPEAVPALREAAFVTHPYLDYDEFFGLARKCTWALADIGTAEAKAALGEIAQTENQTIAGYAQKRLDNWDQELERKKA